MPALPPLPHDLTALSDDVREELERAVDNVLAMGPLPHSHHGHHNPGTKPLPALLPHLIAVHGPKRSGKTSMADFIQQRYQGVAQLGFSAPMIAEVNDYLAPLGHVLDDDNKAHPNYRYLLQMWAQARREEQADYWLKPLVDACRRELASGARLVLMPGLREPIEKEAVESLEGEVWKVVNPRLPVTEADHTSRHPIERALDDLPDEAFARIVVNDKPNLLDWCREVDRVLKEYS